MDETYQAPKLENVDNEVLELLAEQKKLLRPYMQNEPRRWWGTLRRTGIARAVRASNSIEGFDATLDEVKAIEENEPSPSDERMATWQAVRSYQRAMTYLIRTATSHDTTTGFDTQFLKSVHFMMLEHELDKNPGGWRDGSIYVVDKNNDMVYQGPDASDVPRHMQAFVETLFRPIFQTSPLLVRAAMAHLNLVMIHPFKDGNGRMARALQTFILAREETAHPIFASVEEWLGANTEAYYQILSQMSDGDWSPQISALPWIRFCLTAHYQQMQTVLRRIQHYGDLHGEIEKSAQLAGLPVRTEIPLLNAALGYSLTRRRYEEEADVSAGTATRDLQMLTKAGLLTATGEKRGRRYFASDNLKSLTQRTRPKSRTANPYDELAKPRLI